jgi:conjugal transfer pilus assembly protein TraW
MVLAPILAPLAAVGDAGLDEALRAIRDQAAAIEQWTESAETPAWLATNPLDTASAAGEVLGQELRERFREGLPKVSACRDLGQACPTGTPRETGASRDRALVTVQVRSPAEPDTDEGPTATAIHAQAVTITVLASRSLGPAQVKKIFAFAADTPRVRVAFRGVAEDQSLMDFVRQIHGLLAGIEPVPEVVLDPTPFAAAGVDIAPVLVGERHVLYLATQLERSRGWEGLASLEDALDAPVYLLTPDVRQRFVLQHVSAFVEARGRVFIVAEVPPAAGQ